jgi:hypothetical protein
MAVRGPEGREAGPMAAVIASRSVNGASQGALLDPQGFETAKELAGAQGAPSSSIRSVPFCVRAFTPPR